MDHWSTLTSTKVTRSLFIKETPNCRTKKRLNRNLKRDTAKRYLITPKIGSSNLWIRHPVRDIDRFASCRNRLDWWSWKRERWSFARISYTTFVLKIDHYVRTDGKNKRHTYCQSGPKEFAHRAIVGQLSSDRYGCAARLDGQGSPLGTHGLDCLDRHGLENYIGQSTVVPRGNIRQRHLPY